MALDNTELTLLYSRDCPNAIAARAINQRGTGHPHWKKLGKEEDRQEIQTIAQDIHGCLFSPVPAANTVKSSDLPMAGRASSGTSLSLLLDTVNLSNGVESIIPKSKEEAEAHVAVDTDGSRTIEFLKKTQRVSYRICNTVSTDKMMSLDLHPLVYFYSDTGRHQPLSFLAIVELFAEYESKKSFKDFTGVRQPFENFLISRRDLIQQTSRHQRGQIKAVHKIKQLFGFIVEQFQGGKDDRGVVEALLSSDGFSFLKLPSYDEPRVSKKDFTPEVKSKKFIREALETAKCCDICRARIPDRALSSDHGTDKKNDGVGSEENLRWTHHYCNASKDVLVPMFAEERTKNEKR